MASKHRNPALTTDAIVVRLNSNVHELLLIKRKNDPHKGSFAFPGGFVDYECSSHLCQRYAKTNNSTDKTVNTYEMQVTRTAIQEDMSSQLHML